MTGGGLRSSWGRPLRCRRFRHRRCFRSGYRLLRRSDTRARWCEPQRSGIGLGHRPLRCSLIVLRSSSRCRSGLKSGRFGPLLSGLAIEAPFGQAPRRQIVGDLHELLGGDQLSAIVSARVVIEPTDRACQLCRRTVSRWRPDSSQIRRARSRSRGTVKLTI